MTLRADHVALAFLAALVAWALLRLWLATRQIRHVARHRGTVPTAFADRITPEEHRRAADYTIARTRMVFLDIPVQLVLALGFTLFGGLAWLQVAIAQVLPEPSLWRQLALVGAVGLISALVDLPLSWWRTFRLEARFGFNRTTPAVWLTDLAKGTLLAVAIGAPLVAGVLLIMQGLGERWWFWAWLAWTGFNLVLLVAFPTVIAPLFNRFQPLADEALRTRLEALLARCGFRASKLMVMDGSRRSSHGNAYFTGLGAAKRIVLFDTLLERLAPAEIEAVLAHEVGHSKLHHIRKRVLTGLLTSLAGFALLGWLAVQPGFFQGLNAPPLNGEPQVVALLLFSLVMPYFGFLLTPLSARRSRRHEFEADRYAATHADGNELASALVKLYRDNASTLTPDPLHSAFYDSHPSALQRIGRLQTLPGA